MIVAVMVRSKGVAGYRRDRQTAVAPRTSLSARGHYQKEKRQFVKKKINKKQYN